jgi:hypothetical protein
MSQECLLHPWLSWSLDVAKIHWAACPVAWNGQFECKESYLTIDLEAVTDYNLWIWQSEMALSFGTDLHFKN